MKKIRYLSFGYRIANGNYEVVPEEGQLVRQIFSQYLEGNSLLQLAEMAERSGIPYRENAAHWNKNMIARMLDDSRFWQDQRLPPLVDPKTAAAVAQLRRKKATPPCPIQAVRAKLVCCGCGGALLRVSKNAPHIRWDCKTCGRRFGPVTDRELLAAIQVRLEALCQNPSLAEVPSSHSLLSPWRQCASPTRFSAPSWSGGVDTTQELRRLLGEQELNLTQYEDTLTFRIVERMTVVSRDEVRIRFAGGVEKRAFLRKFP